MRTDPVTLPCTQALKIQPDLPDAFNNLGIALRDQGRIPEAVALYHRSLFLRPHNSHALTNLGNVLLQQGNLREAYACYIRAISCSPDSAAAHQNLGALYKDLRQNHKASMHLKVSEIGCLLFSVPVRECDRIRLLDGAPVREGLWQSLRNRHTSRWLQCLCFLVNLLARRVRRNSPS